jgi:hypothetical protein
MYQSAMPSRSCRSVIRHRVCAIARQSETGREVGQPERVPAQATRVLVHRGRHSGTFGARSSVAPMTGPCC